MHFIAMAEPKMLVGPILHLKGIAGWEWIEVP